MNDRGNDQVHCKRCGNCDAKKAAIRSCVHACITADLPHS
jgi:hypothetical protein